MTGRKTYLQPPDMLMGAIHDLAGLQKAETLLCDTPRGMIRLLVTVYAVEREYRFNVGDMSGSRSDVTIELIGEEQDKQRLIAHEFALLDYVLVDRTEIELADMEEWDRQIAAEKESRTLKRQNNNGK